MSSTQCAHPEITETRFCLTKETRAVLDSGLTLFGPLDDEHCVTFSNVFLFFSHFKILFSHFLHL